MVGLSTATVKDITLMPKKKTVNPFHNTKESTNVLPKES